MKFPDWHGIIPKQNHAEQVENEGIEKVLRLCPQV